MDAAQRQELLQLYQQTQFAQNLIKLRIQYFNDNDNDNDNDVDKDNNKLKYTSAQYQEQFFSKPQLAKNSFKRCQSSEDLCKAEPYRDYILLQKYLRKAVDANYLEKEEANNIQDIVDEAIQQQCIDKLSQHLDSGESIGTSTDRDKSIDGNTIAQRIDVVICNSQEKKQRAIISEKINLVNKIKRQGKKLFLSACACFGTGSVIGMVVSAITLSLVLSIALGAIAVALFIAGMILIATKLYNKYRVLPQCNNEEANIAENDEKEIFTGIRQSTQKFFQQPRDIKIIDKRAAEPAQIDFYHL